MSSRPIPSFTRNLTPDSLCRERGGEALFKEGRASCGFLSRQALVMQISIHPPDTQQVYSDEYIYIELHT